MKTNTKKKPDYLILSIIGIGALAIAATFLIGLPKETQGNNQQELLDKVVNSVTYAMVNQDIYDEVSVVAVDGIIAGYNTTEKMSGVTITFEAENDTVVPPDAVVNKFAGETGKLKELKQLNNYLQQNIGDTVEAYGIDEFTVFIKLGETKNDVQVYCQYQTD